MAALHVAATQPSTKLTARQLNRATLGRQGLLERQRLPIRDAVRRAVALQAQEAPSPYIALWNRVAGFEADDLDRAFAEQTVVKTQLMRVTLHAVDAVDYPAFHEAMEPTLRSARLYDRRFRSEGVSIEDTKALVPDLLDFTATPRSNADVERWLEERFGEPKPRIWWALRQYGPFVHAPAGPPWSFGPRPTYIAAQVPERPGDYETSVQHLVRRYLEGFGPATMQDVAAFGTILRPPIQEALRGLADELVVLEGPGKQPLYDVPGGLLPSEDAPAPPRLLPMWDSTLLAYVDRSRIIPPDYRRIVIRSNGDVLPALLVDGYVAGVWRPRDDGIEATAFHKLREQDWAGVAAEARTLKAFLATRDPTPYTRYARWWAGLPAAEIRVL
ncbi:MAG TPA: winged helix DNA-binding domain-containing protein [Candidatus Limnocylindrales bacterium]|nr:winged helix DNA-binding domain-containing protein [Candidatus Limnocylindrales bacterium]